MPKEETDLTQLTELYQEIKNQHKEVQVAKSYLATAEESLTAMIKQYNELRTEAIKRKICDEGKVWCTKCFALIPEDEVELVLVEGVKCTGGSDHHYGDHYHDFSELHRVCPLCLKKNQSRHSCQKRARNSYSSEMRACSHVFRVERRADGFYVLNASKWTKLTQDEPAEFSTLPDVLYRSESASSSLPPPVTIQVEKHWKELLGL